MGQLTTSQRKGPIIIVIKFLDAGIPRSAVAWYRVLHQVLDLQKRCNGL